MDHFRPGCFWARSCLSTQKFSLTYWKKILNQFFFSFFITLVGNIDFLFLLPLPSTQFSKVNSLIWGYIFLNLRLFNFFIYLFSVIPSISHYLSISSVQFRVMLFPSITVSAFSIFLSASCSLGLKLSNSITIEIFVIWIASNHLLILTNGWLAAGGGGGVLFNWKSAIAW